MANDKLLSVKEAAALLNYNPEYFRQKWLDREHPFLTVVSLPTPPGARRRCKIQVWESEVRRLMGK